MDWFDELNQRAQRNVMGGANQDWNAFQSSMQPRATVAQPKKKNDNLAASLLPTGGGIAGTLGGAAAGAAAGSVVPVVGTAIGGLLGAILGGAGGSALGKVGENAIEGNEDLGEGVLGEALLGGVTSLPIGAGFKLARAGAAAAGVGKTSARELLEQAGTQTIGKKTAAKYELGRTPGAQTSAQTARQLNATGDSAAQLATSLPGKLETAGNKALLSQYGTISKPFARSTNPTETIATLANAGITKPVDAERISDAVTGSSGLITRATTDAIGSTGGVSTDNLRRVFNDALDNYGIVEKDRASLQKVFDAQMNRISGGAKGSLSPTVNADDALAMVKSLEKRVANLRGKGDNYRLSTPEREDQASVLQLVRDELMDSIETAGANSSLKGILTPQVRGELLDLMPNNPQWAKYVDDNIMGAKTVSELRSSAAPFVRVNKIIDEGDSNSLTFGGRVGNAFSGGGVRSMIGEAVTNAVKNPAANLAGNTLRGASRIAGGTGPAVAGAAGQGIVPLTARQGITRAVVNPMQAETDTQTLEQALAAQDASGGLTAPMEQPQQAANPTGYSAQELGNALMQAYANNDTASAEVLQQMYDLASQFEQAGGSELNATARANLATSGNAINTLDQLESLFGGAGGGSGKLGGAVANLGAGLGLNGSVQTYNDLAQSSVSQIAKAINGGGQVSDADAAVIVKALPQVTDSPEVAQAKFNALRQRLQVAQQNTINFGTGGGTDLASVLGAM